MEFLLYAGVPEPHRLPEFVGRAQNEPIQTATNLFTDPSFEAGSLSYTWSGAADASVSQKREYGTPIAENLIPDPSLEGATPITDAWEGVGVLTDGSESPVVSVSRNPSSESWTDRAHKGAAALTEVPQDFDYMLLRTTVPLNGRKYASASLTFTFATSSGKHYWYFLVGPDEQNLRVVDSGSRSGLVGDPVTVQTQ